MLNICPLQVPNAPLCHLPCQSVHYCLGLHFTVACWPLLLHLFSFTFATIYCPLQLHTASVLVFIYFSFPQVHLAALVCLLLPHTAFLFKAILWIRCSFVINSFFLLPPFQEHIYKLMKSDSYSRFIRSSAYQELLQAKKKVKFLKRLETTI